MHTNGGGGDDGDGGGSGGGANTNGLLQLRDEVKMCSYRDVHVMWNILIGIDTNNIPAPKSTAATKRRSYWSWRVIWAPSSFSTSSLIQFNVCYVLGRAS